MKPVYSKKVTKAFNILLNHEDGEWWDWFDRNEFEYCCGVSELGNFEDIFYKIENLCDNQSWRPIDTLVELRLTEGEMLGAFAKLIRHYLPKVLEYLIEEDYYGCILATTVPEDGGCEQAVAERILKENGFQKAGRTFRGKTSNRINLWMLRKEKYRGGK